jgi:hypothetical protein
MASKQFTHSVNGGNSPNLTYHTPTTGTVLDKVTVYKVLNMVLEGTLTRDFRPQVFFHQTTPPRPLRHGL